jgi:DcuC family C4-dicarboxylate transporter
MGPLATSLAGLVVIALAVLAILRRAEVRLTLLLAALALGLLVGDPMHIVTTFLAAFTDEKFLLPVGSCMGFAYVLRHTGCDRHLVLLLLVPVQRVRFLLVPGVVLVGVLVNVPIISQAGTAIAVGTVLVPLLMAARLSPTTISAALALGASIGGELLNPGAPELRTITAATHQSTAACVAHVWPLLLIHLAVTVSLFWAFSAHAERRSNPGDGKLPPPEPAPGPGDEPLPEKVNPLKAVVPLVPLVLLFFTALPGPLRLFTVRSEWLGKDLSPEVYDGRLVGLAMLVGVVVAALSSPSRSTATVTTFFEGAGYALAHVTSLVVAANSFGEGVRGVGLADHLGRLIEAYPGLLFPLASLLPLAFAWVSGSGFASTQSVYGFFVEPAQAVSANPLRVGAVVSLSAAAGRTLSPVAAVMLVAASLTGADPLAMMRRLALPLLTGLAAAVLAAMLMS